MDKITVAELATECSVPNQVVLSELKRLGLYVFSPIATIDLSFADTIRKKILSQREAEEARVADAEKKKEANAAKKLEREKKAAKKPAVEAAPVEAAPAPRKGRKVAKPEKPVEIKKPEEEQPRVSLAPRKGRKHYDREVASLVEAAPQAPPKPAELSLVEIAREFFGQTGGVAATPPVEPETVEAPPETPAEVGVEAAPPGRSPKRRRPLKAPLHPRKHRPSRPRRPQRTPGPRRSSSRRRRPRSSCAPPRTRWSLPG